MKTLHAAILHDTKDEAQNTLGLAEHWVRFSRHTFTKRLAAAPIVVSEGLEQSPCSSDHPSCCLTAFKWAQWDPRAGTIANTDYMQCDHKAFPVQDSNAHANTGQNAPTCHGQGERGLFRYFPSYTWNVHTGLNSSSNNKVSCICLSSDPHLRTEGAHLSGYWTMQWLQKKYLDTLVT